MFASAEVGLKAVHIVLTLMACWSTLAVTANGDDGARRRALEVVYQNRCQPSTQRVKLPASCEVCASLPDQLIADCCRWCFADSNKSVQRDERELFAVIDADKRAKYFLGKRPKYFLGK